MEVVSYTSDGLTYIVKPTDSVDKHYEVVRELVTDTPEEVYKAAMYEAVVQGLAYEVTKEDEYVGHFYGSVVDDTYYGNSLYCEHDAVGMVLVLKHIFEIVGSRLVIKFAPHGIEGLARFISLATGPSIRIWHNSKQYVVVTKKDIYEKGEKMYNYLGIACQQ